MIMLAMERNSFIGSGDSNMLVSKYVLNLINRKGNASQSFAIGSFAWFCFRALQTIRPFGSMTVHVCIRVNMDVMSKVRGFVSYAFTGERSNRVAARVSLLCSFSVGGRIS